jgi:hypothetical protein
MRSQLRLLTRILSLLVVVVLAGVLLRHPSSSPSGPDSSTPVAGQNPPVASAPGSVTPSADPSTLNGALIAAAHAHESGVEVEAYGRVSRLLPDDTKGSRHQRFLVRVAHGPTILVAHDTDLAPSVPVEPGDSVGLRGEYIWNDKGGIIHWTHHDPAGRHESGWIEYRGRRYD